MLFLLLWLCVQFEIKYCESVVVLEGVSLSALNNWERKEH
jgi:hypothetical protein